MSHKKRRAALVRHPSVAHYPVLAAFDSALHHVILPLIKLMGISLEVYRPISTCLLDIPSALQSMAKAPFMIIESQSILLFN